MLHYGGPSPSLNSKAKEYGAVALSPDADLCMVERPTSIVTLRSKIFKEDVKIIQIQTFTILEFMTNNKKPLIKGGL
jgi:hypothetical protein